MSLDGSVVIDLTCDGGKVLQAIVTPPRPVPLGPITEGRPIAQAIATISALFRVCGIAQSAAGVEAAEMALGLAISGRTRTARRLVVATETLREHLLRIAFDAALLDGIPPDAGNLRQIMGLPNRLKQALFPGADGFVLGVEAEIPGREAYEIAADADEMTRAMVSDRGELDELDRNAFSAWAREASTVAARLAGGILARDWAMIGCPAATKLEDGLADTSCYARQSDAPVVRAFVSESGAAGLAARLAARFVETSKLAAEIARGLDGLLASRDDADATPSRPSYSGARGSRSGTASAEAARGRLEHRIVLRDDGLVADYAIAAPTSSHFGGGGIAAGSLSALSARTREELAAQADLMIRTIDPCVGYEVRFS